MPYHFTLARMKSGNAPESNAMDKKRDLDDGASTSEVSNKVARVEGLPSFVGVILENSKEQSAASLLPFLSFRDLRSFALTSKAARAIVQSVAQKWPAHIHELVKTWCVEKPQSLWFAGLEDGLGIPHYMSFGADSLAYDVERDQLIGDPFTHLPADDRLTHSFFIHPDDYYNECFANDDKTEIFCFEATGRIWVCCGLLNVETGEWTKLEPMPEPRFSAGILFRVGSKIHIAGGGAYGDHPLCFDLELSKWVDPHIATDMPRDDDFEGYTTARVLPSNDRTVIFLFHYSYHCRTFSLDITSGQWTQLSNFHTEALRKFYY